MPGPTITFGFIVATFIGALFHLLLGGDARRLATFLLASWLGFIIGHLAGMFLGFEIMNVGALRLAPATFGALISLIFVQALTSRKPGKKNIWWGQG